MRDVSVAVTTFERPLSLGRCVRSIRSFYPTVDILVVDDGRRNLAMEDYLTSEYGVRYLMMDFDSGLSAKRNRVLQEVETKYAVFCDDDFIFLNETKLEKFRKVLKADEEALLVAGALLCEGAVKNYVNKLEIDREEGSFYILPIHEPEWLEASGVRYCYADHVFNFFMMRNVEDVGWDEELKISIEHADFSLRIKEEGKWKVAFTPEVTAEHRYERPMGRYRSYRMRHEYWRLLYRKTGLRHCINKNEMFVYSLKEGKSITYPQYIFMLLDERRKMDGAQPATAKLNRPA